MVSRAAPSTANTEPAAVDLHDYPDALDAGLLRIAGVCILASVMAILDGTVVSVAQRTFIVEFGSTQAVVAWTITGYTLGQATVIPLAGWASDRFGTKRLFLGAALWFTLASLLCSMASNITELIAFRIIQGLGGGILVPLTLDHLDARGRSEAAGQVDGGARYPDAPCPDVRAGPRWLADQRLRLAMDFPDQPAGRRDPAGSRGVDLSERSSAPVGGLRLRRDAPAVTGIGNTAVRDLLGAAA